MNRLEMLEKAVARGGTDAFPLYGLALEHKRLGDGESASKCFARLIAEYPDYQATYLMAGRHWMATGALEQARDALTKGIELAQRTGAGQALDELRDALEELDAG